MRRGSTTAIAGLLALAAIGCGDTGASGSGEVGIYALERAAQGVERAEGAADDAEPFVQGPGADAVGEQVGRVQRSLKTAAGHLNEALTGAEAGDFAAAEEPVGLAEDEVGDAVRAGDAATEAALDAIEANPDAIRALLLAADDMRDQAAEAELDVSAAAVEVAKEA